MKKSELRQIIREEIKRVSKEKKERINEKFELYGKPSVYDYMIFYFNEDDNRAANPDLKKHLAGIIQNIKNDWGDDYVINPEDINRLKKLMKQHYREFQKLLKGSSYQTKLKDRKRDKERYKNNLLPLTYDGDSINRPDSKYYYNDTKYYSNIDSYGNSYSTTASGEGYMNFVLYPEYENTPVDKNTLDKHWGKNRLMSLGIRK